MCKETHDELFAAMESADLIDYGKFISGELVAEVLGIEYPETGTKKEFDDLSLRELGAIHYVRNILLGRGMYIKGVPGGYRILSIEENRAQVGLFHESADRKLRRAQKLLANTPRIPGERSDHIENRLELKRQEISKHRQQSRAGV